MQLKQDNEDKQAESRKEKVFKKVSKREMAAFETDGVKGKYLTLMYDYLLTIKVYRQKEIFWSLATYVGGSIRGRLRDNIIDTIFFKIIFPKREVAYYLIFQNFLHYLIDSLVRKIKTLLAN